MQQQKVASQVGRIFDHLLDQSTDYHGMTRTDGRMDDFDFRRMRHPERHKPGYIREVRLEDGVMLQTTTANALTDSLHNLFIYRGRRPNEYWRRSINEDCQAVGSTVNAIDDEQIAAVPGIVHDLGKIISTFEIERANKWPNMIGAEVLARIRIPEPGNEES